MDVFKRTTKKLKDKYHESGLNTRRQAENFPQIEAKVDELVFDKSYKMEFFLSDHPHSVKLNLHVRPPVNCFKCQTGDPVDQVEAVAVGPSGIPGDGNDHILTFSSFSVNEGSFELGTSSTIIVPRSGVYVFRTNVGFSGVTTQFGAAIVGSLYANESLITRTAWSVRRGTLAGGGVPAFFGLDASLISLCIPMAQGDTFTAVYSGTGIAFFGIDSGSSATTTLIALA